MRSLELSKFFHGGLLLILTTNVWILGAAAWNRTGEATSNVTLTEGELSLATYQGQPGRDDTRLALRLVWHPIQEWAPEGTQARSWFGPAKLREIGFRVDQDPSDPKAAARYKKALPRQAYLVLELSEEARVRWAAQHRSETGTGPNKAPVGFDRLSRSRLFAVDAGPSADELRQSYPNRDRFIIVPAVVRLVHRDSDEEGHFIQGQIDYIPVGTLQVPLRLRPALDSLSPATLSGDGSMASSPPRFEGVVAFGRRYEPWLVTLNRLPVSPSDTSPEVPSDSGCIPTPLEPDEGALVDNGRADLQDLMTWSFRWSACPESTEYHLWVEGPGARHPIIDRQSLTRISFGSQSESFVADSNLDGWRWKVRAKTGGNWGPWSKYRFFSVEPVNTDPPLE